jgi:tRNA (guanine37-N1)-methyltransferase
VLISGDHGRIGAYRREAGLRRTAARRPDLLPYLPPQDNPLAAAAARASVVLCHHPVYGPDKEIITTAVTNLDIHDIARQAATFGLHRYFLVTPITVQREKVEKIVSVWAEKKGEGGRGQALSLVSPVASLEAVFAKVRAESTKPPLCIMTTADAGRAADVPRLSIDDLRARLVSEERSLILVLGTGHGLTEALLRSADGVLLPLSGPTSFRHLSVRSASAIILDRLFGLRP